MPRTPQPRRGYPVRVPERVQRLVLLMPVVLDEMKAQRWLAIVKAANAMLAAGISLRRSAWLLQVPVSTLLLYRQRYERGGYPALLRRPPAPRGGRHTEHPSRLCFTLH